jgi:carbon monoxide dehydrogenase subunit G
MRLDQELRIERPPASVFAYLSDPSNLPRWQRTVVSIETHGPAELGSKYTETRSAAGRRFRTTLEIAELEPDRVLTIRTVDGPVRATIKHVLEADGTGTRLRVTADANFDRLPRLVRSLVGRQVEGEFARDFVRLKQLLEA